MELESLQDLYLHELRDLYSAEKQILKALPKMAKTATSPELKTAFQTHLGETKVHVERLDSIFTALGKSNRGPKCQGMEGLLKEGADMMEEEGEDDVIDAGLISAAQRVEHYEMAGYGCARTYASLLGDKSSQKTLQQTLDEEGAADKKLTKIAGTINVEAMA